MRLWEGVSATNNTFSAQVFHLMQWILKGAEKTRLGEAPWRGQWAHRGRIHNSVLIQSPSGPAWKPRTPNVAGGGGGGGFVAWGSLPAHIKRLPPNPDRGTEGSLGAVPPSSCLLDGNRIPRFSQWTWRRLPPCTMNMCCQRADYFDWETEGFLSEGFSLGVYKRFRGGAKKRNKSEEEA